MAKRSAIWVSMMPCERLAAQWRRLFLLPENCSPDPHELPLSCRLLAADSTVRTLVIAFTRASDWPVLASLYENLQIEYELPAPVIAVTPGGFQLWLSLANPVSLADAQQFLQHLKARYLTALPAGRVLLLPATAAGFSELPLIPNLDPETQKWTAFIDPGMGSMFIDEPGLDIAPNPERQADLLVTSKSISTESFRRLLREMPDTHVLESCKTQSVPDAVFPATNFNDPREFLLLVMNSSKVTLSDRITAAKALLGSNTIGGGA